MLVSVIVTLGVYSVLCSPDEPSICKDWPAMPPPRPSKKRRPYCYKKLLLGHESTPKKTTFAYSLIKSRPQRVRTALKDDMYSDAEGTIVTGKYLSLGLGARFSKAPETFQARKANFSSVSKNREVYTPETSCMKGTSVHIKNMRIKQLCNHKV